MTSADRDPEVFLGPDRFDINRDSSAGQHLAFGYGTHRCPAIRLSQLVLEIAIGKKTVEADFYDHLVDTQSSRVIDPRAATFKARCVSN